MKYEFGVCHDTFHFRYHLLGHVLGHGAGIVVLDPGYDECLNNWKTITPEIAGSARVILLDRTGNACGTSGDTAAEVPSITRLFASLTDHSGQGLPLVLVGWAVGACTIQSFAAESGINASAVVLVDPSPPEFDADERGRDHTVPWQCSTLPDLPITVILPGIQPDQTDQAAQQRQTLQQQLLRRYAHRREVIAGGSKSHVLKERPDVVIDAITYYLSKR